MEVLKWKIPDGFNELPEVVYRNNFAKHLATLTPEEICKSYVYMDSSQMEALFKIAMKNLDTELSGVGVDLGSGCALVSSTCLNLNNKVEKLYSVEIVSGFPEMIMEKIGVHYIQQRPHERLVPTIGSFDNLEVEDNSLDFAIEFDSLHHSHDLEGTLKELARAFKPGGTLVAFDRSHPDSITDEEIDKLLNYVYPKEFLKTNFYPEDAILTRKDNGEREIRISEWKQAFHNTGFEVKRVVNVYPKPNFKSFIFSWVNLLPKFITKKLLSQDKTRKESWHYIKIAMFGRFNKNVGFHLRRKTLFICVKK